MKCDYTFKEACFICSSPYQVIGAIGIQLELHLDADIYIYGSFPGFDTLAEKLEAYSLFHHVYGVDLKKIGISGRWRAVKETFFASIILKRFLPVDVAYRTCFLSSRASLKSAQMKILLDRNKEMKRVFFEDGMGTYSETANLLSTSDARRFIELLLGWKLDQPSHTRFMAYLPELVHYPAPFQNCTVNEMPRLPMDSKTQQMICDLFSVQSGSEIREMVIIFDSKRHGTTLLNADQMTQMDQCYDLIANHVGKERVILKPHPRSTEDCPCSIKNYPYPGIPMEVLYAAMPDLGERILVSFVSSAVFTPKILFDVEPVVICLHRIIRDNKISQNFDSIFVKFQKTYRAPSRVMAPASFEELDILLRKYKRDVNDRFG